MRASPRRGPILPLRAGASSGSTSVGPAVGSFPPTPAMLLDRAKVSWPALGRDVGARHEVTEAAGEHRSDLAFRERTREQVALSEVATEAAHRCELGVRFD